jgi:hypothetical protein
MQREDDEKPTAQEGSVRRTNLALATDEALKDLHTLQKSALRAARNDESAEVLAEIGRSLTQMKLRFLRACAREAEGRVVLLDFDLSASVERPADTRIIADDLLDEENEVEHREGPCAVCAAPRAGHLKHPDGRLFCVPKVVELASFMSWSDFERRGRDLDAAWRAYHEKHPEEDVDAG